jgi:hypothetical protein
LRLLATAEAGPLAEFQRARADLLRGQIAVASNCGTDAPPLLLKAAWRFEPLDVRLARETYLEALSAARYAGRFVTDGGLREVAEAARATPPQEPELEDLARRPKGLGLPWQSQIFGRETRWRPLRHHSCVHPA